MRSVTIVAQPTRDALSERQRVDYESFKLAFIDWLENFGKDPKHAEGYANETVNQTSIRVDQLYRWKWNECDGYTTTVTAGDASDYMNHLICSEKEYANNTLSNAQKAIKRLLKWLSQERNRTIDWQPDFSFSSASTNVRGYFTIDERRKILKQH